MLQKVRLDASKEKPGLLRIDPAYMVGGAGDVYPSEGSPADLERGDESDALSRRQRQHEKALLRARHEGNKKALWVLERSALSKDVFAVISSSLYPSGWCLPSGRGAWAFEASDVTFGAEAHLWLAHYDERLRRTAVPLHDCCGDVFPGQLDNDVPVLFDYDGDGEAEVYVRSFMAYESSGSGGEAGAALYTFRGGAILPYPPAAKIDLYRSPEDVDHDGRPDLWTHAGLFGERPIDDPCGIPGDEYAPAFLVHSLADGSFSETDAVARGVARGWCPRPPATIGGIAAAGCARLWASTPTKVSSEGKRIAESCVGQHVETCGAPPGPPDEVIQCQARRAATFAKRPPLTLP